MLAGGNSRIVARDVAAKLEKIRQKLPPGVEVLPLYNRSDLVNRTLHTVATNLLEGAVLVVAVLFALLILWTTRWTVIDAKSLRNNPLNDRTLVQQLMIKRGRIFAADRTVLARSVPGPGGTWSRTK